MLLDGKDKKEGGDVKSMADLCFNNDKKFTLDQLLPYVSTESSSENLSMK